MRYRAFEPFSTLIGQNQALMQVGTERDLAVLPRTAARMLSRCDSLLSLDEHVEQIGQRLQMTPAQRVELRKDLDLYLSKGLLVSEDGLRAAVEERLGSSSIPISPQSIASIGIPTCNRPEGLARAGQAYGRNLQLFSRRAELVVVDDSLEPSVRAANRSVLAAVHRQFSLPIRYAGREQKEAWALALAKLAGVKTELVRFALFDAENVGARSTGANRNALLLDRVGERCFSADDDVTWSSHRFVEAPRAAQIGFRHNPTQMWFLHDHAASIPELRTEPLDLLGLHEQLLGQDVRRVLQHALASGLTLELSELNRQLLGALSPSADESRVAVSAMGLHGDPGLYQPLSYFDLKGPSLHRFLTNESCYQAALAVRRVVRGVTQLTLGNRGLLQTTAYGFDHTRLLPPFFPLFTNQDGLWAMLMSIVFKSDQLAYLPYFVEHSPPEVRAFNPDLSAYVKPGASFGSLLSVCLNRFAACAEAASPERGLVRLGQALEELGTLPVEAFREYVRPLLWADAGSRMEHLDSIRRSLEATAPYVKAPISTYLEKAQEALASEDYDLCFDLREGLSPGAAAKLGQRLIGQFGALLAAWPAITQAAHRLRAEGQPLATSMTD